VLFVGAFRNSKYKEIETETVIKYRINGSPLNAQQGDANTLGGGVLNAGERPTQCLRGVVFRNDQTIHCCYDFSTAL